MKEEVKIEFKKVSDSDFLKNKQKVGLFIDFIDIKNQHPNIRFEYFGDIDMKGTVKHCKISCRLDRKFMERTFNELIKLIKRSKVPERELCIVVLNFICCIEDARNLIKMSNKSDIGFYLRINLYDPNKTLYIGAKLDEILEISKLFRQGFHPSDN